jgi:hypothetical protein
MTLIRPPESWPLLKTADAVIDAVGGTTAAAQISGRSLTQVSNWRKAGILSAHTYLLFRKELDERCMRAPARLWRIDEPADCSI